MELKKIQLQRFADGTLCIIPLEEFKNGFFDWRNRNENCECIKIDPPNINLWVYRKYTGVNILGNDDHIANPPTEEELRMIFHDNKGICFIQVDDNNAIACPSNGRGNRSVIIQLQKSNPE